MTDGNPPQNDAPNQSERLPRLTEVRDTALAILAEGRQQEAIEFLLSALASLLRERRHLELLIMKLRRARAGKTSELLDPQQLALLLEELVDQLGNDGAEALDLEAEAREEADLTREIKAVERARREREKRERELQRRDGKTSWRTEGVRREVHQVAVPEEERTCQRCGQPKQKIGADVTRRLEQVPAHFVEHEYHREKYACSRCKVGVTTAPYPGPAKVIGRSAADASVLAHVAVSKYADHTPLHRLARIYERSGALIPVSTLSDWAAQVADRVAPLVDEIAQRIVDEAYVVRTDATGLKVLDPKSPENIERGTIWCLVGDDKDVVFRYTPTGEGASGPWQFLAGRRGYLQADAANIFNRLFNGQVACAVEVGCWAHARRRFVALQGADCRVAYPLKLIGRLYGIEKLATLQELSLEEHKALRRERSQPVLGTLKPWLLTTARQEPPSSELARACGYALRHWQALTRFVDDSRLDLDNNLCERQLRDIALGRKNYLFAGSHEAAARTATIYSLLRTCAQHGVRPLTYLTDVLRKLAAGWPEARLSDLLPNRWKADRAPP